MTTFSVLEQAPTRAGTPADQSIREVRDFARAVDDLGYHRFWIAEHHALGPVASSAPEALIAEVASITKHLRVGSGGMLLPNHKPLHVAELFRTLEALHPGRIDLGIGRSEGTLDQAMVAALGRPANSTHDSGYGDQVDELLAFGGIRQLPPEHPLAKVRASPLGGTLPPVFMLGSSESSALLAAEKGLGYGFAAYSNTEVFARALRLYRRRFVAAKAGDRPHAILGLRVMAGRDDDHAAALAAPWYLSFAQTRAGQPATLLPVDEARRHEWTAAERDAAARTDRRADVVGGPGLVRGRLEELIAETRADEVIVTTNTFDPEDRLASYRRLATIVGLRSRRASRPPFALPGL